MKFHLPTAVVFIPDGTSEDAALSRTTHLAVSAHQDDIEIMAIHPILECFHQPDAWFTGVVVTDGRNSPRNGLYSNTTDDQMHEIRFLEQKKAAVIGEYSAQVLLDYPSTAVKDSKDARPVEDLVAILKATKPEMVFTHNIADKHDTHVSVALRVIEAIRRLPAADQPKQLLGCEVWRDLDWMLDNDKIALDCSDHENLQHALLGVFDSQISGGKRYDLASMGLRRAHATYFETHGTDTATGLNFAMDLTPLIKDPKKDAQSFAQEHIDRFANDVADRIRRLR